MEIINSPQQLRAYFQWLYQLVNCDMSRDLRKAIEAGNFVEVAKNYKLIEQNSIRVI